MASEIKLYNMDCMEAMKEIPDKVFDLAIVDPPYGGGAGAGINSRFQKYEDMWGNKHGVGAEGQVKVWGYL